MKKFHLHLVSDSTGETVCSVARATTAQFDHVDPEEHVWSLIRTKGQVEKVLAMVAQNPGPVLYTLVDKFLSELLKQGCMTLGVPCIPVLSTVVAELSKYLEIAINPQPGKQHELDENYFRRVEAINFTLAHDDGQATRDLDEADIILIGASRTSKSPTCVYLAYRGFRAANIPFVLDCPLPDSLFKATKPLIIGLTISPDRLVQIRKNRLLSLKEEKETNYIDLEVIREELLLARRIFTQHGWPIIDVTRRSVEETAATIIQHFQERKEQQSDKGML